MAKVFKGVRMPAELVAEINRVCERFVYTRQRGGMDFTEFMVTAAQDKLAKMRRSNGWRRRKREREQQRRIQEQGGRDASATTGGAIDDQTAAA